MNVTLSASYAPEIDAENHARALFRNTGYSHGRGDMGEYLKKRISREEVLAAVERAPDREHAKAALTELFSRKESRDALSGSARSLEVAWKERGSQVIHVLESLYAFDCPFGDVQVDLTTLPYCPYDFKAKRFFVHATGDVQAQSRIAMHELNHFFFYSRYPNLPIKQQSQELYELLKESMTLFSNPEQNGKPNEAELREFFMRERIRSIDEAVSRGSEFLLLG